jgi:hypothetical protein
MARHAGSAGCTPGRIGPGLATWLLAAACSAVVPATTHAQSLADAGDAGDAVESPAAVRTPVGLRWEASPRAALPGAGFEMPHSTPGATPQFDYRVWVGNRRTEFGIGLPSSSPLVVGLRQQLTPQTHLIIDTELGRGSGQPTTSSLRRPFSVGLESSPWHGLATGNLLRAQLSLRSSVALRLRGGRLGLFLHVRISRDE